MPIAVSIFVFLMTAIVVLVMAVSMILMIVARSIFGRSNEVDGPITGMVLVTMLAPVLRMSGRHV